MSTRESWRDQASGNPLTTVAREPAPAPEQPGARDWFQEQARQRDRTTGRIRSRDGLFLLDPDAQQLTMGAATGPLAGVGLALGLWDGVYTFRIGDPAGQHLVYTIADGLALVGGLTATSGAIGGWTISSGALTSGSTVLDATNQQLRIGATAYLTGVGVFAGFASGVPRFRVGDPAGHYLAYDGVSTITLNGQIVANGNIVPGAINQSLMASGLRVPVIVASLPALPSASYPEGALAFLTTDDKLYRSTGTTWTAAVPTSDLSGTVNLATQISGELTTAFAAAGLINANVTINADGTLSGAGAGQVALGSLPGSINLGTQVSGALTAAFAAAGLINANVTVNSDGTLTGAGGGQVSLTSLPGSVAAGQIAANAVTADKINALAVTTAKLAASAITAEKIATNAVTAIKINALAVTTAKLDALAVTADKIAVNAVTADKIFANAVTADKILAGAVTAAKISVTSLAAIVANMGSITAGQIVIGSTNRIWLNDAGDGALAIGGSTKASAPFRVTAAGALTATNATISGTIQAGSVVAASSFTAASPVFSGTCTFRSGSAGTRVLIDSDAAGGGRLRLYSSTGSLATQLYAIATATWLESVGTLTIRSTTAGSVVVSGADLTITSADLILGTGSRLVSSGTHVTIAQNTILDQGASTAAILQTRSSTVAHGMTDHAVTSHYGQLLPVNGTDGGLMVRGLTENQIGLELLGFIISSNTTKTAAANAGVVIGSWQKSGTGVGAMSANSNLLAVRNGGNTRFIVDAEGDFHYDGTASTYDTFDDAKLIRALSRLTGGPSVILDEFDADVTYTEDDLVRAGILGAPLADQGLVNGAALQRLHNGAAWQQAGQVSHLIQALTSVLEGNPSLQGRAAALGALARARQPVASERGRP